jgi:ectoine hydroxylase-related dioxygenase (phytanoyl-CoA dioxygenase family)
VPILGENAAAVRGLLFDKTPEANWNVVWHQDRTVAVTNRKEVSGWGAWTEKAGVTHVQPHATILEQMLTIRLHLDPCPVEKGALRVLPGTHTRGLLHSEEIAALRETGVEVCLPFERGDALLMRPLLLHASSPSHSAGHRRVIHLEYASAVLPAGLEWQTALRGNEGTK